LQARGKGAAVRRTGAPKVWDGYSPEMRGGEEMYPQAEGKWRKNKRSGGGKGEGKHLGAACAH